VLDKLRVMSGIGSAKSTLSVSLWAAESLRIAIAISASHIFCGLIRLYVPIGAISCESGEGRKRRKRRDATCKRALDASLVTSVLVLSFTHSPSDAS
jgi:hypothetical protein